MDETFADRLKYLRKEKGNVTQEEVAKSVNISRTTMLRYEKNEIEPNISTVVDLAKYFGVSLDWLAGYSDIKDPYITSNNLLMLYNSLSAEYKVQAFNYLQYLSFISNNVFYNYTPDSLSTTIISADIPDSADFVTICNNDSMKPLIQKGEYIFIKKEENIKNNDLVFIDINGIPATGKIRITKKHTKIIPINETFEPIILSSTNYKILGIIVNKQVKSSV